MRVLSAIRLNAPFSFVVAIVEKSLILQLVVCFTFLSLLLLELLLRQGNVMPQSHHKAITKSDLFQTLSPELVYLGREGL
jgi:hypothetical protein